MSPALCLNSSFLGVFAHAGFVAGLEEAGVAPARLSGASAGAMVAALRAHGKTGREIFELMLAADLRSLFFEVGALPRAVAALAGVRGINGAIRAGRAEALMAEWFGDARIEDAPIPLRIGVTNLSRTRGEAVASGRTLDYVLASCAVPALFGAREIDGEILVDGGVADPEPIGPWLGDPAVPAILVHRIDRAPPPPARPTLGWILNRGHHAAGAQLAEARERIAAHTGQRLETVLTRVRPPRVGWPWVRAHAPRWREDCADRFEAGRRAAREWAAA